MDIYSYLSMALVAASHGLLIATPVFLIVGLLSKHGPHRTRRLKMALSSFVMFIATAIGVFWVMYLVLLPSIEGTRHEGFRLPYARLSDTMNLVSLVLLIAAASFAVSVIFRTSVPRRGQLLRSLACLLLFSLATGATYYLIYSIQMPAFARFIMIESRPYLTRVGELAPDAEFVMLDGTRVRLSELQGKTVLLNFFATWCGPCQNELPHLQQLWNEKQDDEDFWMLVVSREESQEDVAAFKEAKGFTFPMAFDENREAYRLFAEEGIPRTYLIGKDGKILSQSIGFGEHEVYQNELNRLTKLIDTDLRSRR